MPCVALTLPSPPTPSSISCCTLPLGGSTWLYVGTERGNVYIVQTETLIRSTYTIMWNKVTQNGILPGKLTTMEEHPIDHGKVGREERRGGNAELG